MALIEINRNPTPAQLRGFAWLWFPLFCAAVGAIIGWRTGRWELAAIVAAPVLVVALCGAFAPGVVRVVFVGLMVLTWPIGFVVSHVLMGLVYYGIFTPLGVCMRLFGWDAMTRRLDRNASSYWVNLPPPPSKGRYFRQY